MRMVKKISKRNSNLKTFKLDASTLPCCGHVSSLLPNFNFTILHCMSEGKYCCRISLGLFNMNEKYPALNFVWQGNAAPNILSPTFFFLYLDTSGNAMNSTQD